MLQQLKKTQNYFEKIVQSCKDENCALTDIRVIVVDKDFTEWKVLKEEFPDAKLLFCQWHVMKVMFKKWLTVMLKSVRGIM